MDIDKDKIRRAETRKLNKIAKAVPESKKAVADSLTRELVFMACTLEELRADVDKNGAVELFKNGRQEMLRESPALKSYSTLIQRYSLLYKQLCELLPKEEAKGAEDELQAFLAQTV
nr:MAG TPA: hypothetical protein [Caudoviricetes sp.]